MNRQFFPRFDGFFPPPPYMRENGVPRSTQGGGFPLIAAAMVPFLAVMLGGCPGKGGSSPEREPGNGKATPGTDISNVTTAENGGTTGAESGGRIVYPVADDGTPGAPFVEGAPPPAPAPPPPPPRPVDELRAQLADLLRETWRGEVPSAHAASLFTGFWSELRQREEMTPEGGRGEARFPLGGVLPASVEIRVPKPPRALSAAAAASAEEGRFHADMPLFHGPKTWAELAVDLLPPDKDRDGLTDPVSRPKGTNKAADQGADKTPDKAPGEAEKTTDSAATSENGTGPADTDLADGAKDTTQDAASKDAKEKPPYPEFDEFAVLSEGGDRFPVRAPHGGIVLAVEGPDTVKPGLAALGEGASLWLWDGRGGLWLFSELGEIAVAPGARVKAGEPLAFLRRPEGKAPTRLRLRRFVLNSGPSLGTLDSHLLAADWLKPEPPSAAKPTKLPKPKP